MSQREPTDTTGDPRRALDDGTQEFDPATNRPMSVEDIQESYARYAEWIDRFDWLDRLFTGRYRRQQFASADGRVLDVACGTGTNFRYLPETVELVGIDVSQEMLAKARDELDRLDRDGMLAQMDAQALEFEDDGFDTVISSLSTCTFPDPVAALREMERVCSPDGRILLVEHGRSDVEPIARRSTAEAVALIASAAVFAVVHVPGALAEGHPPWLTALWTFSAGLLFGIAYLLTGELALPMGLHLGINFVSGNVFGLAGIAAMEGVPTVLVIQSTASGLAAPMSGVPILVSIAVGCALVAGWCYWRRGTVEPALNHPQSRTESKPDTSI